MGRSIGPSQGIDEERVNKTLPEKQRREISEQMKLYWQQVKTVI
ncbi:MAG: hypothetical protein ACTS6H_03045 [Candidatus Hodgkinia cicadicola]